ncbi:hypothetical protein M231_01694 [Tremella mesenterica]|uniref:NADH dehydrogenase (Ubiquinone) complex I, assembly factor 6 n=1 Tax=Tremella mesenterica TaxID=5217 RepID=A0A4Q1BSP7_TREME|nr:hypothetical protein M231_01694 [Tremella mesenterica]
MSSQRANSLIPCLLSKFRHGRHLYRSYCRPSVNPITRINPRRNNSTSTDNLQEPLSYCKNLVQRLDPEAWLCSYFWPEQERKWFLAWRAFNLELHLISTTLTQPALAAIRYQFWRDALNSAFAKTNAVTQHPVIILLSDMAKNRPVQKYHLSQAIEVRASKIANPPSSLTFETHLNNYSPLSSSLLLGPLPILVPPSSPESAHLSHTLSHLSHLSTVVTLLRSIPITVSHKKLNIPSDVCARHGIVEEEVYRRGGEAKGVRDACWEIGTRGMDELITARRDLQSTKGRVKPISAMPLFLHAVSAERYLHRLESYDFNVFHPDLQKHDWRLAPRIWWRYQTNTL